MAIAANGRRKLLQEAGTDLVIEDFTETALDEVRRLFAQPAAQRPTTER